MLGRMTTHDSDDESNGFNSGDDHVHLQCMHVGSINKISDPCLIDVQIESKSIQMEIDCGSSVSVMAKRQYFRTFSNPLRKCIKQLVVVNGAKLNIEGETEVLVKVGQRTELLKLLILNCDYNFIPLFGRSWLDVYFPNWRSSFTNSLMINKLNENKSTLIVDELKHKYANIFVKDFSNPIIGF